MSLYLTCLAVTLLVEVSVAVVWSSAFARSREHTKGILMLVVGINCLTHPLAWLTFGFFPGSLLLIEVAVIVVEALMLRWCGRQSWLAAICLSAAMNLASLAAGLVPLMWWLSIK